MSIANKQHGFSLLELMVVVTIAAILLGMGIPAFQTVIADQRSTAGINELAQSMHLARSEAIKRADVVSDKKDRVTIIDYDSESTCLACEG